MKSTLWIYRYYWLVGMGLLLLVGIGWSQLRQPAKSTANPLSVGTTILAVGPVRIREAPDISATRLSYIPWGESAQIMAVDSSGGWYQIEYQGVVGWSASDWFVASDGTTITSAAPADAVNSVPIGTGNLTVKAMDGVRIRTQPSVEAAQLGSMNWGDVAQVLAVDESGQWYQINYKGLIGWSAAPWLKQTDPSQESTSIPVVQAATHVRATGNVRLRSAPDTQSDILDTMYTGNVALYLGSDSSGQWYLVRYNGKEGWSFAEYLTRITDPVPLPSNVDGSPAQTTQVTTMTDNIAVSSGTTSTNAETTSQVQDSVEAEVPVTEVVEETIPVAAEGVVVRLTQQSVSPIYVSPSITSGTLGVVRQGERALVLDIDPTKEWYQVNHQGVIGWVVAAEFETTNDTLDPESLTLPEPTPVPLAVQTDTPIVGATVNVTALVTGVFASPQAGSQVLGTLREGDSVVVLATLKTTREWYQVQRGDMIGWIVASQVSLP